jgi:hypothetical protein
MTVPGAPSNGLVSTYDSGNTIQVALKNGPGQFAIANMAALQALASTSLTDGQLYMLQTDGSLWRYAAASTLTTDISGAPALVATATTAGAGAFIRVANDLDLALAIAFGTANNAVLYTVPTGFKIRLNRTYWEVTTSFTGGSSSAIGVSSSNTNFNTAGDLLGGSSGDVAATLVSTGSPYIGGTLGTKFGSNGIVVLTGGDTIKFNRITSAFTAGAGNVHAHISLIATPAA